MTSLVSNNSGVSIGDIVVGGNAPLVLIAGPCQLQSVEHSCMLAKKLRDICQEQQIGFIFKGSFDKANRSSHTTERGVGLERGIEILAQVKTRYKIPTLTDVHLPEQCQPIAQAVDVLQIPAFLCRQTDLLLAAGETGAAIQVKKGQFLAPSDMQHVARKILSTGNKRILLCERGTSFGYHTLVNDFRGLQIMREFGLPVVFDATHSVQQPGGLGRASGGERQFVAPLARAAVAVGVDALFLETHEDPDKAPSDGPNMVPLAQMSALIAGLKRLDEVARTCR